MKCRVHITSNSSSLFFFVFIVTIAFGVTFCHAGWPWPSYYASDGVLPQETNWTFYDTNEPTPPEIVDAFLYQGPTSNEGVQWWSNASHLYCFDDADTFNIGFQMKVIQSDYAESDGHWDCGFKVWVYDNAGRFICVGISSDGVRMTNSSDFSTSAATSIAFFPFGTTDAFHQYSLSFYNGKATLAIDGHGYVKTSMNLGSGNQGKINTVGFGDASAFAHSEIQLDLLCRKAL